MMDVIGCKCKLCPDGYYSSHNGHRTFCDRCSACGDGLFVLRQCSKTSDTFCDQSKVDNYEN